MNDDRELDETGLGDDFPGGDNRNRVAWNSRVLFAKDDDEYHDPWSKKGKRSPLC